MESIPRYIEGKNNPDAIHYLHPKLKPILEVTYGCMVYQEQVMQIVRDLAGYSVWAEATSMRRAMAKKKHDVMAKEREIFINGLEEDGNSRRARLCAQRRERRRSAEPAFRRNDRLRVLRTSTNPMRRPTA